jgi:hypothetical protein
MIAGGEWKSKPFATVSTTSTPPVTEAPKSLATETLSAPLVIAKLKGVTVSSMPSMTQVAFAAATSYQAVVVNPVTITGQMVIRNFMPTRHIWLCRTELLHSSIREALAKRSHEAAKAQQIGVPYKNKFTVDVRDRDIPLTITKDLFLPISDDQVFTFIKNPGAEMDFESFVDTTLLKVS